MATVEETPLDLEKLNAFVFRAVDEVGATLNTALVVMGDRLGLYRALASVIDSPRIMEAAKTGEGIGWGDHVHDVHDGCERFFRPGYNAHLLTEWLPALDGVVEKLARGATVADVGCGHGASTILMAEAFPNSRFVGFDYHQESIDRAREEAADAGLAGRVTFETAAAQGYPHPEGG